MFAINATTWTKNENGERVNVKQVPTFFLDENVQGIRDENHAWWIAMDILTCDGTSERSVSIDVRKVS